MSAPGWVVQAARAIADEIANAGTSEKLLELARRFVRDQLNMESYMLILNVAYEYLLAVRAGQPIDKAQYSDLQKGKRIARVCLFLREHPDFIKTAKSGKTEGPKLQSIEDAFGKLKVVSPISPYKHNFGKKYIGDIGFKSVNLGGAPAWCMKHGAPPPGTTFSVAIGRIMPPYTLWYLARLDAMRRLADRFNACKYNIHAHLPWKRQNAVTVQPTFNEGVALCYAVAPLKRTGTSEDVRFKGKELEL